MFKRYPVINGEEVNLLQDKDKYDTGIFVYLSNKKDRNSTIKRLGKTVGTPMFFDCPTQYVKL